MSQPSDRSKSFCFKSQTKRIVLFHAVLLMLTAGCGTMRRTVFVHPEYDFGHIERVAVVPFENLSTEQGTASYVTRVFTTELLATNVFDIVEPGEVSKMLGLLADARGAELSLGSLKRLADSLKIQAVIFGSVGESAQFRSGSITTHVISITARMVDVETGDTIWSSTVATEGPNLFSRMLGVGEQTRGRAIRNATRKAIQSLVR